VSVPVARPSAGIGAIVVESMTTAEVAELVYEMILGRVGEVVTPDLAAERARNVAAALVGVCVPFEVTP